MKRIRLVVIAISAIGGLMAANAISADESKPATPAERKTEAAPSSDKMKAEAGSAGHAKDNGLFAYWRFDEPGENDLCVDASGNGYVATPIAAIKRGAGKFGAHCISLSGGEVLNISDKMPQPSAPMSFSVWVKPGKLEGRQYILTYLPNSPETREQYEYAFHLDMGGEPRFWIWGYPAKGSPKEKYGLVCKTKLAANEWSHVVVTIGEPAGEPKKPSKKEGAVNLTYTMYLNGAVVASEVYPVPPFLPNLAYSIGGKPKGEYAMTGDIDELMVFNKQLTAKEVAGLYTANALPKDENKK